MIEVKNLTKRYGDNLAVNNLSFTVEKGKIYGFLGPNGAGKSTTMNIITGCLAATSGQVLIDGHDIFEEPTKAKKLIGYLPEQPPLYNDMTPQEYLKFVAQAKGIAPNLIHEQIEYVMDKTQITGVSKRLIKNLSKGYRQRVGIAQAMLGNPEIIILDEPTVGLDPRQIIEIRRLISSLGEEHTVILSSHILSEVQAICDYVIIIARGNMVASDTMYNISSKYNSASGALTLISRGKPEEVQTIIDRFEEISHYEILEFEEGTKANLTVIEGADVREALFNAFSEARLPILEMSREMLSLEEIYLQLTDDHVDVSDMDSYGTDLEDEFDKNDENEQGSEEEDDQGSKEGDDTDDGSL